MNGLGKLVSNMFPQNKHTDIEVEDAYSIIDIDNKGYLDFETFKDWWMSLKVSDVLGLRQQYKKKLQEAETTDMWDHITRAEDMHAKMTWCAATVLSVCTTTLVSLCCNKRHTFMQVHSHT